MLKPFAVLGVLILAGTPAVSFAQEKDEADIASVAAWNEGIADRDTVIYNWCKKEAFDFGAMGAYRHLFVLSCLNRDVTSAIRVSN